MRKEEERKLLGAPYHKYGDVIREKKYRTMTSVRLQRDGF